MNRNRLTLFVSGLIVASLVLALSASSSADEPKSKMKDVKFACAQHGPMAMMLTLSLESGAPRKVEFIGGTDTSKWVVKIDDQTQSVDNATTVKVRSGDKITWSVAARKHGVVFANKDFAQAMLDFDPAGGKPLKDQSALGTADPAWMAFGPKLWGTDATSDVGILASCKVK
jgi:uncharacterized iron-regulated membrane protein